MSSNHRWFRISLRTLFILLTCSALLVAWFSEHARQRQAAFAAIRKAGGTIQMVMDKSSRLEEWFGPAFFGTVHKIDLRKGKANNELLVHIGVLKELRRLDLSGADDFKAAHIDDEGLLQIAHLPLVELWLQ